MKGERRQGEGGALGLALAFLGLGCSVTLDPTSEPTSSDPKETEACPLDSGLAGASFSSCVELLPCRTTGEEDKHLLCEHALSYEAAAHECELRGGYLAEVNSEEENLLLAEVAGFTVGTNVWLGGTRSEAFVWAWRQTQVVFWRGQRDGAAEEGVFVTWQPGEPNNSSTVSDEPEKCLALTLGGADWNDRACSLELPFACEMD